MTAAPGFLQRVLRRKPRTITINVGNKPMPTISDIINEEISASMSMTRDAVTAYRNPCTVAEVGHFATALRQLHDALGGEIVGAALVRERETDLLDPVGQEVDRVREFLHGRVVTRSEPSDLRCRALAVLDAFLDEGESASDHNNLLALHGLRTRYVTGVRLAARRKLQRMGWVRRAAVSSPRPSGTTTGGDAA